MLIYVKIILFTSLMRKVCSDESPPRVDTPVGSVEGFYRTTNEGRVYRAFEGIPYAKPPVGDLRFEPPEVYGSWEGTLLANRFASKCLQYNELSTDPLDHVEGSEDCLYLNIYAPVGSDLKMSTELLPVLFWIYGGGFQYGTSSEQGSSYIMNRDLVYVTVDYRLGPLGFLSTGDEVIPGNMGLKDQSLALRWVFDNIASFGGGPKRIFLGGNSAGGASAHYHYLSPMSHGLFQGGMSFSGSALDPWAQTENAAEKAKKLAALQRCPTATTRQMVECLKTRPAKNIVQLVERYQPFLFNPFAPFGPVVEKCSDKPFINRSPTDIIKSGDAADVPWITSVVSEEGLYTGAAFVDRDGLLRELNEKWENIAPHLLDFNFTIPVSRHGEVAKRIRKHYLGSKDINRTNVQPLIRLIGDRLYAVGNQKAAKLMAEVNRSPVWFYYYSYRNTFSLTEYYNTSDFGVAHSDDMNLFIANPFFPLIVDEATLSVQNTLLNLVESFVYDGKPTVGIQWPSVNSSKPYLEYLHILGPKKLKRKRSSNFADSNFWARINFNENN